MMVYHDRLRRQLNEEKRRHERISKIILLTTLATMATALVIWLVNS
jgi:hypothetical protein